MIKKRQEQGMRRLKNRSPDSVVGMLVLSIAEVTVLKSGITQLLAFSCEHLINSGNDQAYRALPVERQDNQPVPWSTWLVLHLAA